MMGGRTGGARLLLIVAALVATILVTGTRAATNRSVADQVFNLPGATWQLNFRHFSGYLQSGQFQLHYWYVESQKSPSTDPVVVWLNGGPGCSSLLGLFEEVGPFRASSDSQTLYENVFSWNKVANLLFIESPAGVGFSAAIDNRAWDDDDITALHFGAITDFLSNVFPERAKQPLYLAGEGYAAVYVTLLGYKILQQNDATLSNLPLAGLIFGNGDVSQRLQTNGFVDYTYAHGFTSTSTYSNVRSLCCPSLLATDCDYSATSKSNQSCAGALQNYTSGAIPPIANKFDLYQSCYTTPGTTQLFAKRLSNLLTTWNVSSSDPWGGAPCYGDAALTSYLQRSDVQSAIHVNQTSTFAVCSNLSYTQTYPDLSVALGSFLQHKLYKQNNLATLIYSGDTDFTSTFHQSEVFTDLLALALTNGTLPKTNRTVWEVNLNSSLYKSSAAGFVKSFPGLFDVATIQGAGHFPPLSRPAESLQLFKNFLYKQSYNSGLDNISIAAQPLLQQYRPPPLINAGPQRKAADLITELPGLTFDPGFKQYSGYLQASPTKFLHYWLVESQQNPATDPLLLWLNGGPGSSSLIGLWFENGPIRANKDRRTIFENPYAWNKFTNVLYLESPRGVGFSYATDNDTLYNDETTAEQAYTALADFFNNVFPEYKTRPFYITGESFGGVYEPTLAWEFIKHIENGDININFKGMSIGNGELHFPFLTNSVIVQYYLYGIISKAQFDELTTRCCPDVIDRTQCDFSQYINNTDGTPIPGKDLWCAQKVDYYSGDLMVAQTDPYNLYQDCYGSTGIQTSSSAYSETTVPKVRRGSHMRAQRRFATQDSVADAASFRDHGLDLNYFSTDPTNGFPCWGVDAASDYLNRPEVREALHIPSFLGPYYSGSGKIFSTWWFQHDDMTEVFVKIMTSNYYKSNNMSILLYNGDIDSVCNHLGDQWFAENLIKVLKGFDANGYNTILDRTYWAFAGEPGAVAGYIKKFAPRFDVATVKGSGHYVPLDRPGPALQMLYNWMHNLNYSTPLPFTVKLKPLLPAYQSIDGCNEVFPFPTPPSNTSTPVERVVEEQKFTSNSTLSGRATADQIGTLPGLTFTPTFRQFSGFLNPQPGHYLHYWFVESQSKPDSDPVVLWLNGGPGCSSLGGLFEELGPFHTNNDNGTTLYENVFAWNKAANVIFMEAPVGVGFSYSDEAQASGTYNNSDDSTARDNAQALVDFFTNVFPQYAQNPFYVTGESYFGIYGPTLVLELLKLIDSNQFKLNLKGMAVGNGALGSELGDSEIALQYGHGFNGIDDWNGAQILCCGPTAGGLDCNIDSVRHNDLCSSFLDSTFWTFDDVIYDPYNVYFDCYAGQPSRRDPSKKTSGAMGQHMRRILQNKKATRRQQLFRDNNGDTNYGSTDQWGGYYCYTDQALQNYLRRSDVSSAIHVRPDKVHPWSDCSDYSWFSYKRNGLVMKTVIHSIMSSNWYISNGMRIVIYNGDVDTICNFLGDQWIAEAIAQQRNLTVTQDWQQWKFAYGPQNDLIPAGYVKQWTQGLLFMTIRGAGHFVPLDRPAQALQMLLVFTKGKSNFSELQPEVSLHRQPLLANYSTPTNLNCSRRDANRITELPGIVPPPSFQQYSGYLQASSTRFLHYWLVESTQNASTAPLVLWLNGGPGSSSLEGLLQGTGPFRPNPDRKTLSTNPFSWNAYVNLLYLESPAGVGYSYKLDNNSWNDDSTLTENYAALKDFLAVHPEYVGCDLILTGESYGAVYVSTLADKILKDTNKTDINMNLKGVFVISGAVNKKTDTNSLFYLSYNYGLLGRSDFQNLIQLCCNGTSSDVLQCDFYSHLTFQNFSPSPKDPNNQCDVQVASTYTSLDQKAPWNAYNLYSKCYITPAAQARNSRMEDFATAAAAASYQPPSLNYNSTDPFGGADCWLFAAADQYVAQPAVRDALHIPASLPSPGSLDYNSNVGHVYQQQYNDLTPYLSNVLSANVKLALVYGDISTVSSHLGAEWYADQLSAQNNLAVSSSRAPWKFSFSTNSPQTFGGFFTRYGSNFDVLTVSGAEHIIGMYRPGQLNQVFVNWLKGTDYSTPAPTTAQDSGSTTGTPGTIPTSSSTTGPTSPTTKPKASPSHQIAFCLLAAVLSLFFLSRTLEH